MARRKDQQRQSKDQLANAARKHFNGLGTQENDIVVDFLHKTRSQGVTKPGRRRQDSPWARGGSMTTLVSPSAEQWVLMPLAGTPSGNMDMRLSSVYGVSCHM